MSDNALKNIRCK